MLATSSPKAFTAEGWILELKYDGFRRKTLGSKQKRIAFVDFVEEEGRALFKVTNQLRLEGVMAKRCDSIYRAGKTRDWLKIKTATWLEANRYPCGLHAGASIDAPRSQGDGRHVFCKHS